MAKMGLSPLTFGVLTLALVSTTLKGCEARLNQGEIPTERIPSMEEAPPAGNGGDTPPNAPPAKKCVNVRTTSRSSYYGHYAKVSDESVSTCAAQQALQSEVQFLSEVVNNSTAELSAQLLSQESRLLTLESQTADLLGDGKRLIRVFLTLRGQQRRVCSLNSFIEASELCRRLGFRLNNPYFIHIPCNDPRVEAVGDGCYFAPDFWDVTPGCFASINGGVNFFSCFVDPPAGKRCTQLLYLSCKGYATDELGVEASSRESAPVTMSLESEG